MFLSIKYSWLCSARSKSNIFWILLFPIILGSLFKVAFSNMSASESFEPIPVAIVCEEENEAAETFKTIAGELGKEGENQMLSIIWCENEEALRLLEEKEVDGILYAGAEVTLTVSANMNSAHINQSILETLTQQYNINIALLTDTAVSHPENIAVVAKALMENNNYCEKIYYSRKAQDLYTQYFYNLIAMACLFTSMGGLMVSLNNQGNLSVLGARKNISATNKLISIIGELIAMVLFEFLLNTLAFLFLILVLRVDMASRLPFAILTIFTSTMTGVTLGFFIGSIGRKSEGFKTGIALAITMTCCFLSGLMIGNMRIVVEQYAPFFNRINPAALIADSFYSLSIYESLNRYTMDILTLVLISALFCLGGFLLTRRKKYASL